MTNENHNYQEKNPDNYEFHELHGYPDEFHGYGEPYNDTIVSGGFDWRKFGLPRALRVAQQALLAQLKLADAPDPEDARKSIDILIDLQCQKGAEDLDDACTTGCLTQFCEIFMYG